jgi:Flp pilus assembly protein TadD
MRVLFFILAVFILTTTAQTTVLQKTFDDGIRMARNGDFEKATEIFQRVLVAAKVEKTTDDFAARVHFNLGVCLFRTNASKLAVVEFSEAVKLSRQTYAKAFYALGMAEAQLKNFDQAEAAFRDALKLEKTNGETWFDLAFVYLEKADFSQAETAFANAIKYKSIAAADAFNNLGVIFALRHDFRNAEAQFEKAIFQSNGKSIEAKNNLRFCREIKEKFDQDWLARFSFSRQKNLGE